MIRAGDPITVEWGRLVTRGPSAPASPIEGDLWVDTSSYVPVMRVYNGSGWERVFCPPRIQAAVSVGFQRVTRQGTADDTSDQISRLIELSGFAIAGASMLEIVVPTRVKESSTGWSVIVDVGGGCSVEVTTLTSNSYNDVRVWALTTDTNYNKLFGRNAISASNRPALIETVTVSVKCTSNVAQGSAVFVGNIVVYEHPEL